MKRQRIDSYLGPYTVGVDVSAYQPDVAWPLVASSEATFHGVSQGAVRFAVVRTGDGTQTRKGSVPDPWAVRHLAGAHEARLAVAGYHYVRGFHSAEAQVAIILDVIRTAGVPIAFIALDVEGGPDDVRTKDEDESRGAWWHPKGERATSTRRVLDCLVDMRRLLVAAGHMVLIYSGVAWHFSIAQKGLDIGPLKDCELWTPYYTRSSIPRLPCGPDRVPAPWREWRIWQFAGSGSQPGRVPGIEGVCDLNRFRGDEDAFRAWVARRCGP